MLAKGKIFLSTKVRSLRAAFKAAEERDWRKLDFVKSDALIDYETLMAEYKKGHKSTIVSINVFYISLL